MSETNSPTEIKELRSVIWELYRLNKTQRPEQIRNYDELKREYGFKPVTDEMLKSAYAHLEYALRKKYALDECSITPYERNFKKILSRFTRRTVYSCFWVGNACLDIFVPSVRCSPSSWGLAFEIDGNIHYRPFKMRKDHRRIEYLQKLGIAVKSIENFDFSKPSARSDLNNLRNLPLLDHRSKMTLMRTIAIETIAYHADEDFILTHFDLSKTALTTLAGIFEERRYAGRPK